MIHDSWYGKSLLLLREWHLVDQKILPFGQFAQFSNHSKNSHGPCKGCTGRSRPKRIQHVSVPIGNQSANQLWEWEEETKAARTIEPRVDLITYQRIASQTARRGNWWDGPIWGGMKAFGRWEMVKHMVIYAPLHVFQAGHRVHLGIWRCVQPKATAVKASLSLDFKARWGLLPGRLNDPILIILINGQGGARHWELN